MDIAVVREMCKRTVKLVEETGRQIARLEILAEQ